MTRQQNHLKKSGYSAICDVISGHWLLSCLGQSLLWLQEESAIALQCIVFGCSNRPNKKKGIFLHPISFYGTDDMVKHKRRQKWVTFVKLKHAQWNPWNTLRCVWNMSQMKITLLCFLVWLRLILEGWSWDFDPRNLYCCRNKPAESKQSERKVRKHAWVFDCAAFVFGQKHVSFSYFVFVSEFL